MYNIISNIIGMNSSFDTTHTTIMNRVEINFILPSKLCIGLSLEAKSSNLRTYTGTMSLLLK